MFWKNKTKEQEVKASNDQPIPEVVEVPTEEVSQQYTRYHSALGPGTLISGKLSFDTPVRLDGRLTGEVYSTDSLVIGEQAVVEAEISAKELIIMGSFSGKANVRERTEITATGKFAGELRTGILSLVEGSQFDAICKMADVSPIDLASKAKKQITK